MCHNDTNDAQDGIRAADMWGTVARIIVVNNAMIGAFKSDDFRQSMLDALQDMEAELPVTHETMHDLLQAARFDLDIQHAKLGVRLSFHGHGQ